MDGEIITLTVNTAPVGGIAIIPRLVPLALRQNTVPMGNVTIPGITRVPVSDRSKAVPAGHAIGIAVGVGVGVTVGVGVGVTVGVGVGVTVGVGVGIAVGVGVC